MLGAVDGGREDRGRYRAGMRVCLAARPPERPHGGGGFGLILRSGIGPTAPSSPGPTKIVCEDVPAPPGSVFGSDKRDSAREVARRSGPSAVGPKEVGTGRAGPLRLRPVGPREPLEIT